jgi:hypothetical protein
MARRPTCASPLDAPRSLAFISGYGPTVIARAIALVTGAEGVIKCRPRGEAGPQLLLPRGDS